eukprot:998948_1
MVKNKVDAQQEVVKDQKEKHEVQGKEEKKQEDQVKQMNELNVEEMYHVFLHYMDQVKVECNLEDLANLLKNEMKLDGDAFTKMGRKEFGIHMKTIGIKAGRSGKVFKTLQQAATVEQLDDVLASMHKVENPNIFAKPVDTLNVEEVVYILTRILANDPSLSNLKFDMYQVNDIVTKNELNGAKCKEMKRKDFCKLL